MAPIIAFLICTWALLLLVSGRDKDDLEDTRACVFPFHFRGRTYSSCTTDSTPNQNVWWCATSDNYEVDKWKPCALEEYGGNSKGAECVFPFIYKGRTYYTCTKMNSRNGNYWCAITKNYDKHRLWSYCAETRLYADIDPFSCVIPFIFQGKKYETCTTAGRSDGKLWCSLFPNFDRTPFWAYCENRKNAGISKDWRCWFPFTFKGQTFNACTNEDDNGQKKGRSWCSTTPNYDLHKQWSYCSETNLISPGQDGTSTRSCVFPFSYLGVTFTSCTLRWSSRNNPYYWCYLADGQWKHCEPSDMKI